MASTVPSMWAGRIAVLSVSAMDYTNVGGVRPLRRLIEGLRDAGQRRILWKRVQHRPYQNTCVSHWYETGFLELIRGHLSREG